MAQEKVEKFLEEIGSHLVSPRIALALSESVDLLGERIDFWELNLRVFFAQLFEQLHHLAQMNLH